ncbi:SLC13 family permease [Streptomyces sedi]|uniref:SLC13 family permease n=1 Tax=Streptomyces sedi TaxID=555059 RepID=UPI001FE37612|nr:SLC13 family permease [Streptomyces sedi]
MLPVLLLLVVLAGAVLRPRGLPEAAFAVPAAAVALAVGAVSWDAVAAEVRHLAPVVGFLAAVLVLAKGCEDEGLFTACGRWMARGASGHPRRLLGRVFLTASLVTVVLSLDATVVLLTPVVFVTASAVGARPRPHVYACTHLANTASLLLPVSNLTNLLAFAASGLSLPRFAALMALPWAVAIGVEYLVMRRFFAADLAAAAPVPDPEAPAPPVPVFALCVLGGTLLGFVVAAPLGFEPVWAAAAGAAVLAARGLARGRTTPLAVLRSASPTFLLFVLALGVVVRALVDHGLADVLGPLLPDGAALGELLVLAALAAVLANLVNNLPAVLVLLPLVAPLGPGAVLAVLLGVNIGPNLTYAGSLATLLWRRVVRAHREEVGLGEFTRLGLLTVVPALTAAVLALWAALALIGAPTA